MPRLISLILIFLISIFVIITHGVSLPTTLLVALPFLKSSYSIAIYGDSMVDTMGENLEYLQAALKRKYPNTTFNFYNYGIGSENVEDGIARFDKPFDYKTRHYPPISKLHPDIIVVGSFSYNPFYPFDKDRHWNGLTNLVREARATGADVYMLSEIAPLKKGFGKGPNGVNLDENVAYERSSQIVQLLQNTRFLAIDHIKVPLIDVYTLSLSDGKFGSNRYVDSNDGIHPSVLGHQLTAEAIASRIKIH